jgi:hypothetical protein
MTDVPQLLAAIHTGAPRAAGQLLPLVYDELRRRAAARLSADEAGHTLPPPRPCAVCWSTTPATGGGPNAAAA